ncbi:hypothetical protein EI982_12900 [Haloplanus rallus]|jgi:hypothetical protein|uniref:MarR family transcriptional regulator n=1 Tax=Haloplanus rallus TaxID=1816183 RepID=A0A6B9F549_9EURY|nr:MULTISPECIES: hypothetical protein [Haloplanus]QGX95625.1 hypothetical protein EI982_12900 [Haloplanus rallus]
MRTHTIESSVILYRNGTLTLSQAARRAGCSDEEMASAVTGHLQRAGIDVDAGDVTSTADRSADAD